ncbi:lipopolysaccharide biosynthesis protein [Arcticibacter eurypsychrophilus]|uniref:lipopolysaccharide biosynthesis protein n=1 Tax=Arcticibacter eurypsychrophilus TaxID=1434752 RepID=UPI00084D0696|nr:lipopolysaccharide biosynthesis protein [Arcticibacter eurypsychrophilus]
MSSLRKTTVSGLVWTFSQQFGVQLISFGITIILARLLAPSEFGLIAMLTVFMAAGSVLVDGGLSSSLIRSDAVTQRDYSTVFFFNLGGSIVIYALVYSLAPYIAHFYKQEILISVIRVYAIVFVMNAFYEIQNARLTKAMNFKIQTIIQIPAVLAGGLLGVIMAMQGYGVWSLVWMNILQSFLITVFHWVLSGWRPSLIFDKSSFKTHFNFGYKMTLSGLLEILYKNIYVLIIGKNYSATQLGYYSRADSLSQLPTGNIATAMNKVTYPMFASISQDNIRLKVVYKKLMQQVIFWNAACLVLLYVIAEPLFRFLITDRWLPAVPYFKILCIAGILYPLHAYNLNILKVKGRSDLLLKLEGIKKTISIAGIFCVIPFGIYGLLYFQLLFNVVACYINSFYSGKMINYPVKEQLKDILPTLILSAATGIVCHFLDIFLQHNLHLPDLGRLLIDSFTFFTVYLGFSHLAQLDAIYDFKQLILRR